MVSPYPPGWLAETLRYCLQAEQPQARSPQYQHSPEKGQPPRFDPEPEAQRC